MGGGDELARSPAMPSPPPSIFKSEAYKEAVATLSDLADELRSEAEAAPLVAFVLLIGLGLLLLRCYRKCRRHDTQMAMADAWFGWIGGSGVVVIAIDSKRFSVVQCSALFVCPCVVVVRGAVVLSYVGVGSVSK